VEDSRTSFRESFPEDIEDHWRYFKDDPHFHLWETDPRYRVVIGSPSGAARTDDSEGADVQNSKLAGH